LSEHNLQPSQQSAYQCHHSTEMAMLWFCLMCWQRRTVDVWPCSVSSTCQQLLPALITASFFSDWRRTLVEVILQWLKSFLHPMCAVWSPSRFSAGSTVIHSADSRCQRRRRYHSPQLQQYADDCQEYVSIPANDASTTINRLSQCITDIARWAGTVSYSRL